MAGNKTRKTAASVKKFLDGVDNARRREDAWVVHDLMAELSGQPATMWGSSLVGFGSYHYKYDSGREGDFMRVGFSPRKQNMVLYIMPGFGSYDDLMAKLGKHKTGKSCLYINKLDDVHMPTLRKLVAASLKAMKKKYPD
ncbi:MAG: DUF1801 domain-containing protein [Gammaproteobacteria bacterium]|nr:DUF1801 domain-containing protein [Gammaproteobacteria bacterium]